MGFIEKKTKNVMHLCGTLIISFMLFDSQLNVFNFSTTEQATIDKLVKEKMPKKTGGWWFSWRRKNAAKEVCFFPHKSKNIKKKQEQAIQTIKPVLTYNPTTTVLIIGLSPIFPLSANNN